MNKKRNFKIIIICLLIIIAIFSIVIYIKNQKLLVITQLKDNSSRQMMGYIMKTKNNIIVIDGGTIDDTENLKNHINQYGGTVNYWFITHAHDDHAGAFTEIYQDSSINIEKIYISLNNKDWYEKYDPTRADFGEKLIDIINNENINEKVHQPELNEKFNIDNVEVEILGICNPEITENAGNEQSMVIKFKTSKSSLLILGDTGIKSSEKLLKTQKENLDCDVVQMSHHGQNGATKELYEAISPKICLWPTPEWLWNNDPGTGYNTGTWKTIEVRNWMDEIGVKENYIEKDGDLTIEI